MCHIFNSNQIPGNIDIRINKKRRKKENRNIFFFNMILFKDV
jgi:hypothetical protein